MTQNTLQSSFTTGELSPSLFARTDLTKYHSGAATMRNFFVDYRSGASSRAGLQFINESRAQFTGRRTRLIPFQFSSAVSYVLEFTNLALRFYTNGAPVLEAGFAISGATNANPCVLTIVGNNYIIGDWIFVQNVGGMTQLNGRYYIVSNVAGNLVTIQNPLTNIAINSFSYGTYTAGGTAQRVYTIASPYADADLPLLKFVQLQNVMYFTHTAYPPATLTATAATNWAFANIVFATPAGVPTGLTITPSAGGTANYGYEVTSVDANGQESVPVLGFTNATLNMQTTAGSMLVQWIPPLSGAVAYNVYKSGPSTSTATPSSPMGFIVSTTGNFITDTNFAPDFSQQPPIVFNPFTGVNFPGCSCFFQQRWWAAGSNQFPTTFWASTPGFPYTNFNTNDPVLDTSSIQATLISIQLNAIKSMIPMPGGLIMLTYSGAWQVSGGGSFGSNAAVTPINITASPQAYNGANDVPPIIINFDILYVQSKGSIVRDLSYNIYAQIYTGTDISVLSNHLFLNHSISEWAYAEEPYKIVWAVRDDGVLLSLTYVKEQEMAGWARHDTLGIFQSVCTVREGNFDVIYVAVRRLIQGNWVTMVERMDTRTFLNGAEDAFCVDCGLSSTLVKPAANLTASSSTGGVTFTADAPVFGAPGVVSNIDLRMDGGLAAITTVISATQVSGTWVRNPTQILPDDPNNTPLPVTQGNWSYTPKFTIFQGLDHLEGQMVSILADGGVVTPQTVTAGTITLPQPASNVHAGLAYTPQLQLMPLDISGGETVQFKRKVVSAIGVKCADTRGLLVGPTFNVLTPMKEMNPSVVLGSSIPLVTGEERLLIDAYWTTTGQSCFQINDPLPASILGVVREYHVGDNTK